MKTKYRKRIITRWCLATFIALFHQALLSEMINMIPNPGFEAGMPEPWYAYHTGDYKVVRDPKNSHSGTYYGSFSWRKPPPGGAYSGLWTGRRLEEPRYLKVYPGVNYRIGIWAKGKGAFNMWIVSYSKSGRFMNTDFDKSRILTGDWKHYERTWKPEEGIYNALLCLTVIDGTVAQLDDAEFSYDSDKFTPPEAESLEVVPKVEAADATFKLYLNDKPFNAPAKIIYGEQALAIEAQAAGPNPKLSGSVQFGKHQVKIDWRWRATPKPDDYKWRLAQFDDTSWNPVKEANGGVWAPGGTKSIALRRVVHWKSSRKSPMQKNQWLQMVRDRIYIAEGSAGGFVQRLPIQEDVHSKKLLFHVEVPGFLKLLDRYEKATNFHSNYAYRKVETKKVQKAGIDYTHFTFHYDLPTKKPWKPLAPFYMKADDRIQKDRKYTFTFWREINGNITDLPLVRPLTVTGPVNGRQCKYFDLTYNRPHMLHTGGFGTYSIAERYAMADTCIAAGMNVVFGSFDERMDIYDYFLSLKKRGVKLCWGFNVGMNWPFLKGNDEGLKMKTFNRHPEVHGRFYEGSTEAFENGFGYHRKNMNGKTIWCQEYLASGGRLFYDTFRPRYEEALKKLGDIYYSMWDWEYGTIELSCFCSRCKTAFKKFAKLPADAKLSDEVIATNHHQQWIKFRFDQSARHQLAMMKFLKEYDIILTNWHPGGGIKLSDFDYSLLGDAYEYHFMGWPGSTLPLLGMGRDGFPGNNWKKQNPNIHLVAQTIVDYFPHVIDERMFKIWTLNVALGTQGGGWFMWLDSMYPLPQSHGMSYFIGEATRLINDFEEFFKADKHIEAKFEQQGLTGKVNELIALQSPNGKRALVLLFNQSEKPAEVIITLKENTAGWNRASQWEGKKFERTDKVKVNVGEKDVVALVYE